MVAHPFRGRAISPRRFDTDRVVDYRSDALRSAEVTLGGLDGDMTKEELNLLQFAAGCPA